MGEVQAELIMGVLWSYRYYREHIRYVVFKIRVQLHNYCFFVLYFFLTSLMEIKSRYFLLIVVFTYI